jgi:hypothetical protein
VGAGHGVGTRGSRCVGMETRHVQLAGGTGGVAWRARLMMGAEGISPLSVRDPVPCSLPFLDEQREQEVAMMGGVYRSAKQGRGAATT